MCHELSRFEELVGRQPHDIVATVKPGEGTPEDGINWNGALLVVKNLFLLCSQEVYCGGLRWCR